MPTARGIIRPGRPLEADQLTSIAQRAKAHWGYTAELLEIWKSALTITPKMCDGESLWVLEVDGHPIGFGELIFKGDIALLDDLWIDPAHMRAGYGQQLFRFLCKLAATQGARILRIESDPHAVGFYERMGASIVGKIVSDSVPGRTLPILELELFQVEATTIYPEELSRMVHEEDAFRMKYGMFTVSSPTLTLEEVAPKLQELGYDGWELRVVDEPPNPKGMEFWHGNKSTVPASTFKDNVERIKKLGADHRLELFNLGTYVRSDDEWTDIERAVANAVAIGAPSLRINVPLYSSDQAFKPIWDKAREDFKRIEELVAKNNVRALIETHHGTVCPSASSVRMMVDGRDPKHIGVIHDLGNMVYEGYENYRMGLEMLGDYLALVHVKNATAYPFKTLPDSTVEWRQKFWPMHQGVANVRALISALLDIGYDGWISFEDFSTQQKIDDRLKFNIEFVKNVVAEEVAKRSETTEIV